MVEATLEVPTSYVDRVFAIADANRTLPLVEVLERLSRDAEMEPIGTLYNPDRLAQFVSLLRPWDGDFVAPSRERISLQRDERLPLWQQSDNCINIYIKAAEDLPAWTLLLVAERIVKAIERRVREHDPEFAIELIDVVAGSGGFRARCSNIVDNAIAGIVGTLIAALLVSATSEDQQKDEIIALQRDIIRLDRSRSISGFTIYREQGEYGRVDNDAIENVPKIDRYLHNSDVLSPTSPIDFITFGIAHANERGSLVQLERNPGRAYVLFDDREGGEELSEGLRYEMRGFFATNSRNKEVVFVLREIVNANRRSSRR